MNTGDNNSINDADNLWNDNIIDNTDLWNEFVTDDKYNNFFMSNEEIWRLNLKTLKKYIDIHNMLPPKNEPLGIWMAEQMRQNGTKYN
jgi:hypothetical protein